MVGSYVDRYFEGTLDAFKSEHTEMFKKDGNLKAEYVKADALIQRAERDELFMKYMSGEKQVIMTAELYGTPWKIKMDSYIPGVAIVDLKVMASLTKLEWVRDIGYLDFVRYWGTTSRAQYIRKSYIRIPERDCRSILPESVRKAHRILRLSMYRIIT